MQLGRSILSLGDLRSPLSNSLRLARLFVAQLAPMGASFAAFFLAARFYDAPSLGELSFVYATVNLFGSAVGSAIGYRLTPKISSRRTLRYQSAIRGVLGIAASVLIASIVSAVIFLLGMHARTPTFILAATCVGLVFSTIGATISQIAIAADKPALLLGVSAFRSATALVPVIIGIIGGLSVNWVVGLFAFSSVLSSVVVATLFILPAIYPFKAGHFSRFKNVAIREQVNISPYIPFLLSGLLPVLIQSSVSLNLTASTAGLSALAYFNIARQWQGAVQLLGATSTSHFLSRLKVRGEINVAEFRKNERISSLICLALTITAWPLSYLLSNAYGFYNDSESVTILVTLLILSGVVQSLNPISNMNYAFGNIKAQLVQNIILAVSFTALFFLLRGSEIHRLAYASAISGFLQWITQEVLFKRRFPSIADQTGRRSVLGLSAFSAIVLIFSVNNV